MQCSLLFLSFGLLSLVMAQEHPHTHPQYHPILIAHGVLMGAAFVLLMPLGVFLIRLTSFKGLVWWHAGIQMFAYVTAVAAFGLGAWMATISGQWKADNGHPILGTIIIGLLLLQPVLGYVHHLIYVRSHKRTFWIYSHIWYGRALIILAVINGGLGLQLSSNTVKGEIAYGVVAGVMFLIYLAVLAIAYLRKDKSSVGETGEKMIGGPKSEKSEEEVNHDVDIATRSDTATTAMELATKKPASGAANGRENSGHAARSKAEGLKGGLEYEDLDYKAQDAGPHELSIANKLDPKVDLDQGGNQKTGLRVIEHATAGYDAPLTVKNA